MSTRHVSSVNLSKFEIQNAVLQNLAAAPSNPKEGQIYYSTTDDIDYVYTASGWVARNAGGTGQTNLGATLSATNVVVTSDTGTDATIPAADATNAGLMVPAQYSKLAGIEANADVTDATNVDAAGAVMVSDLSTEGMGFVIDEDNMASNSATKVPTQQSTKAYVDTKVSSLVDTAPGTLDTLNELAAALGDDPNFATTVTTSIGTKLAKDQNLSDVTNAATAFGNIKQAASTTATGVVELATTAEAEAKTDTVRAVTPASLTSYARKVTGTIGDGTTLNIVVTHNLGSQWVDASLYEVATNQKVMCDIELTSATTVTYKFEGTAPTTNQYRYIIIG